MCCAVVLRRAEGGCGRGSWQKFFGGFDVSIYMSCDPPSHRAPYHFLGNLSSDAHGNYTLNTDAACPREFFIKILLLGE